MIHRFVDLLGGGGVPYVIEDWNGSRNFSAVWSVEVSGDTPSQVTSPGATGTPLDQQPDPSLDGSQIVFVRRLTASSTRTLWTISADGTNETQIDSKTATITSPTWSRQGNRIAYILGSQQIIAMDPDGANEITIYTSGTQVTGFAWSSDGTQILFAETPNLVRIIDTDGTDVATLVTKADIFRVAWGFESDFIVYSTSATGGAIYRADTDGTNEVTLGTFASQNVTMSHRFWAIDDSAGYLIRQDSGPGNPYQIYRCPFGGSGASATDIWTTGNSGTAPGRPHCFRISPDRFYVCAYESEAEDNLQFVSYALDGTDRRTEDTTDPFLIRISDGAI